MNTPNQSLSRIVFETVSTHHFGPIQDDTLIVEIRRPLGQPSPQQSDTLSAV